MKREREGREVSNPLVIRTGGEGLKMGVGVGALEICGGIKISSCR